MSLSSNSRFIPKLCFPKGIIKFRKTFLVYIWIIRNKDIMSTSKPRRIRTEIVYSLLVIHIIIVKDLFIVQWKHKVVSPLPIIAIPWSPNATSVRSEPVSCCCFYKCQGWSFFVALLMESCSREAIHSCSVQKCEITLIFKPIW